MAPPVVRTEVGGSTVKGNFYHDGRTVAAWIDARREHLHDDEFRTVFGVSYRSLLRWRRGERNVQTSALETLADAQGVHPAEIVDTYYGSTR